MEDIRRNNKTIPAVVMGLLLVLCMIGVLWFPAETASGAGRGVAYCMNILVPSLFPFMTLSTLMVLSGFAERIGYLLRGVVRGLFYLPGCAGAAILMSLVGGYPVGAKSIAALREKGSLTDEQAARMLCFCVNSGPAFVITAVGYGMLGSIRSGLLLLTALIFPPIIFGIGMGIVVRKRGISCGTPAPVSRKKEQTGLPAIVTATADASRATLMMCAFVILFSALNYLLHAAGISVFLAQLLTACGISSNTASAALSVLLEVVSGCTECAVTGVGLPFIAFALGWGGLCIHFQIFSVLGSIPISKVRFYLFRVLHGLISALLVLLGQRLLPVEVPSFSTISSPVSAGIASSLPGTVALLALSVLLLFSLKREWKLSKKGGIIGPV